VLTIITGTRYRPGDLTHVDSEVDRAGQQILAAAELEVECASRYPWGTLIEQAGSTSPWQPNSGSVEYLHLLDQTIVNRDLGVYRLSNRALDNISAAAFIGVCPWYQRRAAAQFFWTECLYSCGCDRHAIEAYLTLKLPERPSNDQRPGYSRTRHGTLLHFDAVTARTAQRYFFLDEITEPIGPTTVPLGADNYMIFARSNDPHEPLRIMIVEGQWNAHRAAKELKRWLTATTTQKRRRCKPSKL
jgi:hypothetical protein